MEMEQNVWLILAIIVVITLIMGILLFVDSLSQ